MKVLVVRGYDDDYAALEFERSDWTVEEAIEDPKGLKEFLIDKCNCSKELRVKVYEFKSIDPKFVDLVEDFMDYDSMKQSNFYYIEGV